MLMMELIAIYSISLLLRNMQRCTFAAGGRWCHCLQRPSPPAGCQREERVEAEQRIPHERSSSMADARPWPEGRRVQNPGLGNSVQDDYVHSTF